MDKDYLNLKTPLIVKGGNFVDERGSVSFINEFTFDYVKRFYIIKHTLHNTIRAWQAHKNETKYFYVTQGEFIINLIKIENWENPSNQSKPLQHRISQVDNSILIIPKGYANGFINLDSNSELLVFSSSSLEESLEDDYRFDESYFFNCDWRI